MCASTSLKVVAGPPRHQRAPGFLASSLLKATLLATLLAAGCAQITHNALSESMVVTVSKPDFALPLGTTLTWYSSLVYFVKDSKESSPVIADLLQAEIQGYLEKRGYYFPTDDFVARYALIAVVVLGKGVVIEDVLEQLHLTPTFPTSWRYEKGTIVAALVDPDSEEILWRGALQAHVDPKHPLNIQLQRIREGVHRLFSRLPQQPTATDFMAGLVKNGSAPAKNHFPAGTLHVLDM